MMRPLRDSVAYASDMADEEKSREKSLPLFVTVYETLYKRIKEGVYPPGEKLPAENTLAEELNVSRSTLRQGILLLQEDGLIMNQKGRGSFVLGGKAARESGVERLNDPLIAYCNQPVDQVTTSLQFQVATEKHRAQFDLAPSSLIALAEFCYYAQGRPAGLGQVFILYDLLAEHNVELERENAVYEFYSRYLETEHLSSDSAIRIAYARESTSEILQIEKNAPMIMMEESIHHGGRVVIFQKLFFLPDYYELKLMRRNERYMLPG